MPSEAIKNLNVRLSDVDELITAHEALTGGGRGRPAARQGAAVTKAAIVLLTAIFEAFVEDIFERATVDIFPNLANAERRDFLRATSGRLNSVSVKNVNFLYAQVGYPFILDDLSWRGFSNANLKTSIDAMVAARNKIAHGGVPNVTLSSLRRWKNMVGAFSQRFEDLVLDHAEGWTDIRPNWEV